jgi:BTB/POZ domain
MDGSNNWKSILKEKKEDSISLKPLQKRLMACLKNDDKVADVHLVGDDGIPVPALRIILSCTSPVFEAMLYGKFSESTKAVVPISGCNCRILQNLVDYCCSDQLNLITSTADDDDILQLVTESILLAELGDKYEIPGLEAAVVKSIKQWIEDDPSLACVVFNLSHSEATPQVRAAAWQIILECPQEALQSSPTHLHGGITSLSPPKLQELYQDVQKLRVKPLYMFHRLLEWYMSRQGIDDEDNEQVTQVCREAVGHIDLAAIDPQDLHGVVKNAPFVAKDDVMQAFMQQAMMAHRFGLDFSVKYNHGDQPQCRRVMVEGAGIKRIDGIYVQDETPIMALIRQQFTKRDPATGEQVFLVQGKEDGVWFICDPSQVCMFWFEMRHLVGSGIEYRSYSQHSFTVLLPL